MFKRLHVIALSVIVIPSLALMTRCSPLYSRQLVGTWLCSGTVVCNTAPPVQRNITLAHTVVFQSDGLFTHQGTAQPEDEELVTFKGYGSYAVNEESSTMDMIHIYFDIEGIPTELPDGSVKYEFPDEGLLTVGDRLVITFPEDIGCAPASSLEYIRHDLPSKL